MSRRGNCWDNSSQESYFGHMKDECDFSKCSTPEDVKKKVDEYIYYYNYERPQWSRNKMTPVDYENIFIQCRIVNIQNIWKSNRKNMIR